MHWTYEKYLRNQELAELENQDPRIYLPITDLNDTIVELRIYPTRSVNKILFSSVDGFIQHPNSSRDMYVQVLF